MRYGIEVVTFGEFADPRVVVRLAQAAEAAGWEGLWVWDHITFAYGGVGDPWVILSAVAASTKRLKLCPGIAPLPRYRPHVLARILTSLDILSEGRLILGAGLGGVEEEFTNYGEPADAKVRAAMLEEGLEVLTHLWSGEQVTYRGAHYVVEGATHTPTPVQRPRIPVWIGGESKPALRRAARWDGWIIGATSPEAKMVKTPRQLADQVAYIHQHRASDTPFEVAIDGISGPGDGALAREYEDAGATWWFEGLFGLRGAVEEMLARVEAGPPR
jgi:alkanesulfonate monooxygenase SsuD/methylene tetrahydromethanopterin reductase-like flavin-dependent oxidoreductase (luciferase family)